MPPTLSFALGLVVTFASALYFADKRMKTGDYWFRGFPALWNIVAIYLFVLRLPVIVSSLMMLLGSAAMIVLIVFVHPLRVKKLRAATITASLAFFALSAAAIWQQFDAALWVKAGFVIIAVYFFALPLIRHSPWAESGEEW